MKGKEYLKGKEKVLDMRKNFEEQKVILTDCYHWKDIYEALRLEREDILERINEKNEEIHKTYGEGKRPFDIDEYYIMIAEEFDKLKEGKE